MLIDDWIAVYKQQMAVTGSERPEYLADLQTPQTQRFVLAPLVADSAYDLARPDAVERSRDMIFTPARMTWIEWRGRFPGFADSDRHGLLVRGAYMQGESVHSHGSLVQGTTSYVFDVREKGQPLLVPFAHDFLAAGPILSEIPNLEVREFLRRFGLEGLKDRLDRAKIGAFLAAICAMIATPRVTTLAEHDLTKLNRAREKRGHPPYLHYHDVNINIDDYLREKSAHQTTGDDEGGISMHHVRAHIRMRLGKVEFVRPHWRGDPARGIIITRRRVRRAEDEPGDWQGEPLPGPEKLPDF